jgi:ubiquitin-activating enzyme E1
MGKLIKMKVVIVGLRGLGVEVAKNLILAGPNTVHLYDPDLVRINDLGANFYCELQHVGKVSRAEACATKLKELNPYVKVELCKDEAALNTLVSSGNLNVLCQTELMLGGKYVNPQTLNDQCRQHKVGFISSQTFGPWGYGFLDYGVEHLCTDPDGEAVKNYIVTLIVKGEKTVITTHEDKRHIYQPGDYVVLKEVEGMNEINDTEPLEVIDTTKDTITLKLDSTNFGDYLRQGVIENIKVPQKVSYHPWSKSYVNPVASSRYGMLETPDLAKFGRSEQLHAALMGVLEFLATEGRYPENTADDQKKCLDLSKALIAKGLSSDESNFQTEIED